MKVRTRSAWLELLGVAVVALLLLGGCQNRNERKEAQPATQPEAQGKPAAAAITVENGQTFITLDTATQKRLGFTVATLSASVTRAQATFPAVVVPVQELATFRNAYVATQAAVGERAHRGRGCGQGVCAAEGARRPGAEHFREVAGGGGRRVGIG